jgi:hypothetical protein
VSACIYVLEREASVGHSQEAAIDAVMRDVAARIENELNQYHWDGFWRIGELRAWKYVARASRRLAAALQPQDAVDRPVPPDARVSGAVLAEGESTDRRQQLWRRLVAGAGSVAERARLAVAWVAWAVGTREPDLAAEAYQQAMGLVPLVVADWPEGSAQRRVLAAAQEHTEEAGYWLARTGRYREAVVALETGRAVGLSQTLSPTRIAAEQSRRDVRRCPRRNRGRSVGLSGRGDGRRVCVGSGGPARSAVRGAAEAGPGQAGVRSGWQRGRQRSGMWRCLRSGRVIAWRLGSRGCGRTGSGCSSWRPAVGS